MSTLVTTNLKHGGSSSDNIVLNSDGTFNVGSAKFETPSGSAPMYQCRAWVNFDGTTTPPTIRASGNVSSVTRTNTGRYTINFTTAMPDANYVTVLPGLENLGAAGNFVGSVSSTDPTASSAFIAFRRGADAAYFNNDKVQVAFFR